MKIYGLKSFSRIADDFQTIKQIFVINPIIARRRGGGQTLLKNRFSPFRDTDFKKISKLFFNPPPTYDI